MNIISISKLEFDAYNCGIVITSDMPVYNAIKDKVKEHEIIQLFVEDSNCNLFCDLYIKKIDIENKIIRVSCLDCSK